jgi:hypothetical protein
MSRVRREERYDEQKVKAPARKRYPTNRNEPMIAMAKGGMTMSEAGKKKK